MAFGEIMYIVKAIGFFVGPGIAIILLKKWLGKEKEEIENFLKWQEFYEKQIEDLKSIIKDKNDRFELKLNSMQVTIDELETTVKISITQNEYKDNIIKEKEENRLRWENDSLKHQDTVKKQIVLISEVTDERDEFEKENIVLKKEINQLKQKL